MLITTTTISSIPISSAAASRSRQTHHQAAVQTLVAQVIVAALCAAVRCTHSVERRRTSVAAVTRLRTDIGERVIVMRRVNRVVVIALIILIVVVIVLRVIVRFRVTAVTAKAIAVARVAQNVQFNLIAIARAVETVWPIRVRSMEPDGCIVTAAIVSIAIIIVIVVTVVITVIVVIRIPMAHITDAPRLWRLRTATR